MSEKSGDRGQEAVGRKQKTALSRNPADSSFLSPDPCALTPGARGVAAAIDYGDVRIGVALSDADRTMALPHARQLRNMLDLARVITLGALNRNESRGAHYKPDFPNRDDANWLKTTIAEYSGEGPVFSYDPVDTSLIPPRKRDYSHEKKETAKA